MTDPIKKRLHLEILGPDTLLLSDLCAACPQGSAGCCKAPPSVDWSDIGRILHNGGREFLLARIAAKDLVPTPQGLAVRRVRRRESNTEKLERKCVFHGRGGCTIENRLRPATCNYFLCDDAFQADDEPNRQKARAEHEKLRRTFEAWDEHLAARIRSSFPEGPPWDQAFLDWLHDAYTSLPSPAEPFPTPTTA